MNKDTANAGYRTSRRLGLSLLILLFLIPSEGFGQKQTILKIATLAPEGSSWMKTFQASNTELMKKTNNQVQLRIYPGGVLGDEADMLRKMQIGQVQGAALTSIGLSKMFKEVDVLQVPFLFQTYEEVDHVLAKTDGLFRKGFEDAGYVLLGWSEAGFVYLLSTVPVSSVSDIKKARVWIWEDSTVARAVFDEIGVKAIPLTVPDVLVGLQTGLVDVVYAPPSGAIALQWFTKVKYLVNVPLVYSVGGIVIRKDTFLKLPQSYQSVLVETCQRQLPPLTAVLRNENREAIQVMAKQGVQIITPSAEQIEEFKKFSSRAMAQIGNKSFSKQTMEEVVSILSRFRKEGK